MNYNIISYLIYLPIIFFIMIKLGWVFYKNGAVFLYTIFKHDSSIVSNINNLLLIGFYLVNLGYATYTIACWEYIETFPDMISTLGTIIGKIVIGLGLLHYNNIFWLIYMSKKSLTSNIN